MTKLKVGDTYSEPLRFAQSDVELFAECTGDKNPIHLDAEYAAKTPFGKPIVHGILAGSVFSKIFGTTFPGEGTIYMMQEMVFRAPVFVDNDYIAKCEIIEIDEEKHRAVINCVIEDAEGKQVLVGKAKLQHSERF